MEVEPDTNISGSCSNDVIEVNGHTGMYQVVMLAISLSILQIGFGFITPIFPVYITELGMGGIELGVLAASFALTRILFAGPLGSLSDNVGRKKILVFSLLGFAVSNVIYAMAQDAWVMIAARAMEGAVSAGFFPAANAFVSDMTTPENRGTAMGYLSTGNMVGFVIGPVVGGVLAEFLGIRLPFVIAAMASILTMVLLSLLIHEPERKRSRGLTQPPGIPLKEVLSRAYASYGALAIAMFANMFAIGVLEVAFMLDAVARFGIGPLEIGGFFGVIGVFMIIGNIGFGKLSDKRGRKWLIVIGAFIGTISMLMFATAIDTMGFYLAGAVLSLGMSMRGPAIQALIADLTDPKAYGRVMGLFGAVSNSAYVVSPTMSGYLFDMTGNAIPSLLIAGGVSFIGGVVAGVGIASEIPSAYWKVSIPIPDGFDSDLEEV
ncbi:MFS transporter [Candidatus Thorarchaeota archaeon]|nr:MAG: MFS transporter [Candidatus Thorarchaeota archaeon]